MFLCFHFLTLTPCDSCSCCTAVPTYHLLSPRILQLHEALPARISPPLKGKHTLFPHFFSKAHWLILCVRFQMDTELYARMLAYSGGIPRELYLGAKLF